LSDPSPPPRPIPLWAGLYAALIVFILFFGLYSYASTTTRGWLATGAVAAELCGVLMIASPELRPRVVSFGKWLWTHTRRRYRILEAWFRRLVGLPLHARVIAPAGIASAAGVGAAVILGRNPPRSTASVYEKVAYLLAQDERWHEQFQVVRNETRQQVDTLRAELAGSVTELMQHAEEAVAELANKELQMRLLGVAFLIVGLGLGYAANLA
jgi:hypothetical protein